MQIYRFNLFFAFNQQARLLLLYSDQSQDIAHRRQLEHKSAHAQHIQSL